MLIKIYEDDHAIVKKVEWFPFVLGRSMNCDVQITHPSVSARHAVIEFFEDSFLIRDLGSKNGLYHDGQKIEQIPIKENTTFWLGDAKVEVIVEEKLQKTGPSQSLAAYSELSGFVSSIVVLVFGYLGAIGLKIFDFYGREWPPESYFSLLGQSFVLWLPGAVGTALISLFSKLNVKKFNFKKIAVRIFLFGFVGLVTNKSMDTILFNLRQIQGSNFLEIILPVIIVFFAINSVMYIVLENISSRVRLLIGMAFAVSTIFVFRWRDVSREDNSGRTKMTRFGLQFTNLAGGIDNDTEDLKTYLFRSIAEVDGKRNRLVEKSKKVSETQKEIGSTEVPDIESEPEAQEDVSE